MLQVPPERPPGPLDRWKRPGVILFLALATVGAARWLGSPGAGQTVALPTIAARSSESTFPPASAIRPII